MSSRSRRPTEAAPVVIVIGDFAVDAMFLTFDAYTRRRANFGTNNQHIRPSPRG